MGSRAAWASLIAIVLAQGAIADVAPEASEAAAASAGDASAQITTAPPAEGSEGAPGSDPASSPVSLDRLLTLPADADYGLESRGGDTRGAWRARFRKLRSQLDAEREGLAKAQAKLEEVAAGTSAWSIAPPLPGAQNSGESPLDFELRQEMRRRRTEIEHLEGELKELQIEANLAGVPEEWRE